MDGTGCQDHRHRDTGPAAHLVGQNDMAGTRPHRILSFGSDPGQTCVQIAGTGLKRTVDGGKISVEILHQLIPLGVADKRAVQRQNLGLRTVFVQHVLEVTKAGLQRHHPEFAQTVDGRVCHLAEVLAKEMAERAILLGQDG